VSRRGWITLVVTLIAVAFAIRFGLTFPWDQTLDALADADWLLLAAAGVTGVISLAAKGAAWHLLLRRLAPLRFSTAQTATFVGAAVNSISISVSGEAARAQLAGDRDGVPFGAAAISLVATRVVEALGLLVFLALAFILLPPWPAARPIGVGLGALAALIMVGYRLVPWNRVHSQALGRWHETFVRMAASNARGGLIAAVSLAAFSWLAQWLTYHWSIAATHTAVTPAVSLSTLVMANIAGVLRLTPGNIGVMQGSLILGMHAFEIPAADALAAGLALQAVMVLPVLAIGIGIVGRRGFRQLSRRRAEVV
jgi:putative heme transporter